MRPGLEAEGLGRSGKSSVGGHENRPLVYSDCWHWKRAPMKAVIRGLWVNALATRPLGQIHTSIAPLNTA